MNEGLCEILNKCIEISSKYKADVFFEYAPHVNAFSVYAWRNGWTKGVEMEWLARTVAITNGNLITTMAKLLDLEYELGVA